MAAYNLPRTCHLELISEEEQSELIAEIHCLSVKADMDRAEKKKLKSTKNDLKKKDLDDRDDNNDDNGDWDDKAVNKSKAKRNKNNKVHL
jgi:hypothetical protein